MFGELAKEDVYCHVEKMGDEPPEIQSPLYDFSSRQRELSYIWGRYCAEKALSEACGGASLLRVARVEGEKGPLWPPGFVGSIAHSKKQAISVVASDRDYWGLGVDVEELSRGDGALANKILTAHEKKLYQQLRKERALFLIKVFSMKEAIYKALFPHYQKFFGFHAAEIDFAGEEVEIELKGEVGLWWEKTKNKKELQAQFLLENESVFSFVSIREL